MSQEIKANQPSLEPPHGDEVKPYLKRIGALAASPCCPDEKCGKPLDKDSMLYYCHPCQRAWPHLYFEAAKDNKADSNQA